MSPKPTRTHVFKSLQDLDPALFEGEQGESALAQVVPFVPRAEIEDESGYPDLSDPDAQSSEMDGESQPETSEPTADSSASRPPQRILIRDLCQDLVAAGVDADEGVAMLRIRAWYAANVENGADKAIVPATQARKALREAVASWIAAAQTTTAAPAESETDADGSSEAAAVTNFSRSLTVDEAKEELMEFIIAARASGQVQELADKIFTLGFELGVSEERLFLIGKKDKAWSPTRDELEADTELIKKTWYYAAAFWMSKEDREPKEFLADWYWPGTKPRPVRTREPRSQEAATPVLSLPPLPATKPDPVSTEPDKDSGGAEPAQASSDDDSPVTEVLDPERQFRVHRTGLILDRLEGESDEDWQARTRQAVKDARREARNGDQPASGTERSPFSTESATPTATPIKSVSSLPGGGLRIVREDGTTEDKPFDWATDDEQGTDAPEGADDLLSQPVPVDAGTDPTGDEPVEEVLDGGSEEPDDLDDELARITRDAEFMFDQGVDPEAVFAALLD